MRRRRIGAIIGALAAAAIATVIWWFAFDSRAPSSAGNAVPLAALREAVAMDAGPDLPRTIELYRVGTGAAPMFAVEAGGGFGKFRMAYTAFGVRYGDERVMIDAAVDRATAEAIGDRKSFSFDDDAYRLLLERIASAQLTVLTHEHKDHVMALVRHPELRRLLNRVWMPAAQVDGALGYVMDPAAAAEIREHAVQRFDRPIRIAPGVAVAPTPGHSPGSLVVYVRLQSDREYLFVGDIAWSFNDVTNLRTRPRFLQWLMFDPNEVRDRVLAQLRALHDIHTREPGVVIVPSHDSKHLDALLEAGIIVDAAQP